MIFKTIKDDATKSGEAITFLGKKISDIKDDLKSGKGFVNSLFGSLNSGISNDQLELINKWNSKIQDGCTNIDELNSIISNADEATQKYFQGLKGAPATLDGLAKATGNVSTEAKIAAKGMGLLKTTLNTLTSIGIMALVNLGVSLLQAGWEKIQEALKSTDEKIKELTQDLNSSLQEIQSISKEFQNLKSSADEVIPKFAKMSEGVDKFGNNISLTDEEYKEFISLNNQIADMFPELNVGLDSNGNAMLALSGNADTLTESLYALLEVQRKTANQKITDGFGDAFENTKNLVGAYKDKKGGIYNKNESIKSDYAEAKELIEFFSSPEIAETIAEEKAKIAESTAQKIEEIKDEDTPTWRMLEGVYQDILQNKILPIFQKAGKESLFNDFVLKYDDGEGNIDYLGLINDNIFQDIITGFDKQSKDIDAKIQSIWNNLSSSISAVIETNPLYSTLDSQLQQVAKTISAGLDMSNFADKTSEEVKQYIESNILSPLYHIPIEAKEIITQIPNLQEKLKEGSISKDEFSNQITEAFNSLYESMDEDTLKEFSHAFVSGYNQMGIEGDNFIDVLQNLILYYINCAKAGKTAEGATKSFIEVLSNVQSLSNGLDKLASIYKDIQNQDDFDWSRILNNKDFAKQFENCGIVYTDFIKTISNSTTDIDTCQEAFNNLVTEYCCATIDIGQNQKNN